MTEKKIPKLGVSDPSSYANPDKIKVKDMQIFWDIDFTKQVLSGKVHLKCEKRENVKTQHLVLDCSDLKINKITTLQDHKDLEFDVGQSFLTFGSPLCITLPPKQEDTFSICIEYETSPKASALQWLPPEETIGKQAPFLFSQCQAIHCRSIIPCQDTPSVKCPYKAEVTAPKELMVLMSALKTDEPVPVGKTKLLWRYAQPNPVPPYLVAIVAGRLKGKVLGGKTKVYSEPEISKACAFEFSETEKLLNLAVKICGPYVWGRYDLLVLPPSFPFGGMENPCLTCIAPTLLVGDKSLSNIIAHEISHSWSGNLVTNSTFEHFWLNEGFTTYIERKITGAMFGESRRHFQALLGLESLQEAINYLGSSHPLTCLVPKLKHIDPDDAFSAIPYEKGHTLLFYLETLLNEDGSFGKFLQSYIEKFKFQSIKSENFKNYLYEFYRDKKDELDTVDWFTWLYCPGMPPIIPAYDRSLAEDVDNLIQKWESWVPTDECLFGSNIFSKSDLEDLTYEQQCLFLKKLLNRDSFPLHKIILMSQIYQMETIKNSEVKVYWLRVCIKGRWNSVITDALKFVNDQGRVKFVRPIYRDLYEWEEARQPAIDNFLEHKSSMMFVLANLLEKDLHLAYQK